MHLVTIYLLGNYLSQNLNIESFLLFSGIFIVLWYAWCEVSIFNSIFVSTDVWHKLIMSGMICTLMFIGASIPAIDGKG
jgi:hypothetical protein